MMLDNVRFSRVPTGRKQVAHQEANWGFHGSGEISSAKSLNQRDKMSFRMAIYCCQDILSAQTITLEKKVDKTEGEYPLSAENKAIMQRLIEEFNRGNEEIYDDLVSPDYVNHTDPPGPMATREGWKQKAAMFHKAFPDLHTEIDQIVAEGDLVVTAITSTGTHQGEVMGISATGKKISVRGVHINKIVNGKIVARWELTDMMSLMVQLGVVTPPGG